MSQTQYVVKLNTQTDLYLKTYSNQFERCEWSSPEDAIVWDTLAQAQSVASLIGHGTVGTTKP